MEKNKLAMSNECVDGLEHDIMECPNCGCEFCEFCDKIDAFSEEE